MESNSKGLWILVRWLVQRLVQDSSSARGRKLQLVWKHSGHPVELCATMCVSKEVPLQHSELEGFLFLLLPSVCHILQASRKKVQLPSSRMFLLLSPLGQVTQLIYHTQCNDWRGLSKLGYVLRHNASWLSLSLQLDLCTSQEDSTLPLQPLC